LALRALGPTDCPLAESVHGHRDRGWAGWGRPGAASALCGHTGRLPLNGFLAAVAAGDIHVGPDSGPVHVAAAAGKPSVVIYGEYIHPDCVGYPRNINLYTALPCSPCWLLMEPCPYDRMCLRRISPERVEEAIASLARVGPWGVHDPLEQMR